MPAGKIAGPSEEIGGSEGGERGMREKEERGRREGGERVEREGGERGREGKEEGEKGKGLPYTSSHQGMVSRSPEKW